MVETPILALNSVSKQYDDVLAVNALSFQILEGQCFGLLGPNGAGKTTTLEMIEGMTPPSSGAIHYRGGPVPSDYQDRIGIQFQATALQDFLTPFDNLKLFSAFYDHPLPMQTLVDAFQLKDFLHRDTRRLSGGQRQRLLLALALVHDPEIVFLDEPTTGLDPRSRRDVWDVVQRLKAEGRTLVLTTHYMEEAEVLCDDLIILSHGAILRHGSPTALLAEAGVETLDALFLSLTGERLDAPEAAV
ncbi:MAG: ABC transporter ATP-binding protein [Litorivicinaceae bacterium]|jgi:ABC-2 type transport system ATP-binding protein|nr:ABC transporter ATP-binding protein [Litorivicinaceae bacterium]MDP5329253.1 ABC transporter ATP-binding protein [Litorivicinaceae bacterium]MDP5331254.1 ABC transporter ATP-binding protein [Litorivicinaceae bacterium]MDP5342547.1 ABC transporter ATP-binding protein [Litorivicinaceae bacterium]MDP5343984.1 ABC transporter ATP-binding protein [Litorivicinaceae bacterium]